ncbi:unnamed protein product [Polarella glacialis]|uniref:Uncharacterized protein n=1 Tax=Polarella glacialis TaxID=89957 RepID=A0A813E1A4_POLGL|nr:unnamed protein product [Polarella glacialis]
MGVVVSPASEGLMRRPEAALPVRPGIAAPSPVPVVATSGSDSSETDLDALALSLSAFVAERGGRTTRSQVAKFCAQNPQAKKVLVGNGKLELFCEMYPSLLQFDPTAGAGAIVCVGENAEAGSRTASRSQLTHHNSSKASSADAQGNEEEPHNSRSEAPRAFKPPDGSDPWSCVDPWSVSLNMGVVVSPASEGLMRRPEAALPVRLGIAAPSPVPVVATSGSDSSDTDLDALALSLSAFVAERGGRTTRSQVAKFCAQNPQAKKVLVGNGKLEQFCEMYPSLLQFDPTAGAGAIVCVEENAEAGSRAAWRSQLTHHNSSKASSADAQANEEEPHNSRSEAPRAFKPPDGSDPWSCVDPWSVSLNMGVVVSPASEGLMQRPEAALPSQLVLLDEKFHNADERDVGHESVSSTASYEPELHTSANQTTPFASSQASDISDDWEDAVSILSEAVASKSAHHVGPGQGDEPSGVQLQYALGHAQALCQFLAGLEAERQSSYAALQARESGVTLSEAALAEREARLAKREEKLQAAVALAYRFGQDLGLRLAGLVSEA